MKRLVLAVAVAVVGITTIGVAPASAHAGDTTTNTFPVSFVMSSATCANLPAGTTINGTGIEKSTTTTRTGRDGVTTVKNSTRADGTAVDQDGNTYRFIYINKFRVNNTVAAPGTFTGRMTDVFKLSTAKSEESDDDDHGQAILSNGFLANITTDLAAFFSFDPIRSNGDPIDFITGAAHCDPL
jgi:hypothetical protein